MNIKDLAQQLYAIELLEYHNKNYLSGDNKTRSEAKQGMIADIIKFCDIPAVPKYAQGGFVGNGRIWPMGHSDTELINIDAIARKPLTTKEIREAIAEGIKTGDTIKKIITPDPCGLCGKLLTPDDDYGYRVHDSKGKEIGGYHKTCFNAFLERWKGHDKH